MRGVRESCACREREAGEGGGERREGGKERESSGEPGTTERERREKGWGREWIEGGVG